MFKNIGRFILLGLLLSLVPRSTMAQETAWAKLSHPNTDSFPYISTYLNVYDGEGKFVHDLGKENVNIIENQRSVPISEITELHTGAQFVVAINMGPAYAIKDSQGVTRYEHVQAAMTSWINTYPPETIDDLSLVTNDGIESLHIIRPAVWLSEFAAYQPNFDTAIPSLDVLARAITTAADPVYQSEMGRGVLLITPLPNQDSLAALPSLESLARQGNVRVYIWMVSSRAYFDSAGANLLAEFTRNTGGQLFLYSGDETLPNIDPYVDQLRHVYALNYNSQISGGDTHEISAQISTPLLYVTSDPIEFSLSIQPPNPIFVAPPLEIIRNEQVDDENLQPETPIFTPNEQLIEILIEFPDNFTRSLSRTILYVDGVIAAENTSPPFEQFSWPLEAFDNNGSHLIQVEAVDELGLSGISIEHQVDIAIQYAPFSLIAIIKQNWQIVVGIGALIGVVTLFLVLVLGGKIQPKTTGRLIWRRNIQPSKGPDSEETQSAPEPITLTQNLHQETEPARERLSTWMNRFSWPARKQESPREEAYLEILSPQNGDEANQRLPISQRELTFGNDATLATIELSDPSIDALHARLFVDDQGDFIIFDEESIAGTWVNYVPVTKEGTLLTHGDIIHIGRIDLRFVYTDIKKIPKPKVTLQESL